MGTSAACMWATIHHLFRHPRGRQAAPQLRRIPSRFYMNTNDFGVLRLDFNESLTSVVFLDLNIRIESNVIKMSTYQTLINLYQYITPSSDHPPRIMRGIIFC
ncbi:hypothetical protein ACHAWF_012212 [Thalassiosira exigua]